MFLPIILSYPIILFCYPTRLSVIWWSILSPDRITHVTGYILVPWCPSPSYAMAMVDVSLSSDILPWQWWKAHSLQTYSASWIHEGHIQWTFRNNSLCTFTIVRLHSPWDRTTLSFWISFIKVNIKLCGVSVTVKGWLAHTERLRRNEGPFLCVCGGCMFQVRTKIKCEYVI